VSSDPDKLEIGQGRITHGPRPHALVERTLEFIEEELPLWRDRSDRLEEAAEEKLNAQLCKHLNAAARKKQLPVMFHHEEKQLKNRRVDISAGLDEGGFIGSIYHSIDKPFLVIEGKRLPAPGGKARETEYVSGGSDLTGGVQRFRLGLHGAGLKTVALIGYLQNDSLQSWFERINGWIKKLSESSPAEEKWRLEELLEGLSINSKERTSRSSSVHPRITADRATFEIRHLWVEMSVSSVKIS
jgi:hypothetical protein